MSPDTTAQPRRFAVHGVAEPAARAHVVEGASFEDAALNFAEDWSPLADAVSVIVEDCATGERQCFHIDLESGRTSPCD